MHLMLGMAHSMPRYTRRTDPTIKSATNGDSASSSADPASNKTPMGGGAPPDNLNLAAGAANVTTRHKDSEENPNMLVYKKVRRYRLFVFQ